MNCYHCAREARQTIAIGICSWCGGAVCGTHAREYRRPLLIGVSGASARPVQLVCTPCLVTQNLLDEPPLIHRHQQTQAAREAVVDLPDAAAAIRTAELILCHEPVPVMRRASLWDRLGSWLSRSQHEPGEPWRFLQLRRSREIPS